jgi:hypothetical protein
MRYLIKFGFLFLVIFLLSCEVNNKHEMELKELSPPVSDFSMHPYLFAHGSELLMSWTEQENDSVSGLYFSKYSNGVWSEKSAIIKGQNWFVNWADFPAISADNDNLISYYLKKSDADTYAYDIFIKQSNDAGKNWTLENKLHSDTTKTEHGFVSLAPSNNNSFFISWLDGRNTKSMDHDHVHGQNEGAMQIRVAEVMSNGEIVKEFELDSRTCDCCNTSTALTGDGPIVVWRDRSEKEIRDIYYSKFKDGIWSESKPVYQDNWEINGCPVNGPKVAVQESSVAVAWFTAADNIPKVNLSFSKDIGEHFLEPITISQGNAIGRVDLLMLDEKIALISWMESSEDLAFQKIAKVGIEGKIEKSITIQEISGARSTGFPQMELVGDHIVMAWNHVENGTTKVKVFTFSLEALN